MKNLIKIILTVFLITTVINQKLIAQVTHDASQKEPVPANVTHITDKNADKFVGTWVWKEGNDLLKITLLKDSYNFGGEKNPKIMDLLKGGYQFSKAGKDIVNTLSHKNITGGTNGETNTIYLMVANEQNQKSGEYILTYVDATTVRLESSKRKHEGARYYNNGLSLPTNIVLHKEAN